MGVKIALSRRESGVADFRGGFGRGGVGPPDNQSHLPRPRHDDVVKKQARASFIALP